MSKPWPTSMRPRLRTLLPDDATAYGGPTAARWIAAAYLALIVVRSLIHLFAPDGGAHAIATIDIEVAGGRNIVAMFGQWGAIQLLLASLLWLLWLRYRGLTPLVLATLSCEPFLRGLAGHLKPLATIGVAPGAELNWAVAPVLLAALYLSLCPVGPVEVKSETAGG